MPSSENSEAPTSAGPGVPGPDNPPPAGPGVPGPDNPPPAGWEVPGPDNPPAAGWEVPGQETPPSGPDLFAALGDVVGEFVPEELQRRLIEAIRELLVAVRALIDWLIARLERGRAGGPAEVRDIPIL
ncbi:MAG TPA: hypothetical protein VME01_09240 [Solirubrobacteraceae bacterium]|nr:hypothetical protein [Solirubrobacteraceae bacterium]